ncbi:MAG: adenylate/guanylate cyclase domain-containing protein [Treponema sp.]|nr:adenylate/guanylate cyclase domain-containing protein [Treponema sp.]
MHKHKRANKKIAALVISAAVFAFTGLLHLAGAFGYLENRSYDLRVRFFAPFLRPSHDIVVVLIDQGSIDWAQRERGWGWPWPRTAYAQMLEFLGYAASVTFDIIFSEPSMHHAGEVECPECLSMFAHGMDDDAAFAHAAEKHGRVVQGVFFSSRPGAAESWPADLYTPLFEPYGFDSGVLERFGRGGGGTALIGAQFPIAPLRDSAAGLGSLTGIPDPDGIIRRMRLFTLFDGRAVPGLASMPLLVSGYDGGITLNPNGRTIKWGGFSIPVGRDGSSLLRFRGDLDRYFPFFAKDILESRELYLRGEEPPLSSRDFYGAHVFVGVFAPGLFDIFATPISPVYMGMGVHVTMLDNILRGDFARESRRLPNLLVLLALVVLTVLLCLFSKRVLLTAVGTMLALALAITGSFAAYYLLCLWVPMITFLAGITAAFVSTTLFNYATEGSQKRFIKTAFSQYLSPKVIERIIADPSQLRLGGEKSEMTAMFTDVRAFSTISEALGDPRKLVELLNHYLTRMSDIVLENQGTIDKYEGDAIIAFFGAPAHFANHAALACRSAVQMKKAEFHVNREALDRGLLTMEVLEALAKKGIRHTAPLFTRIGVNSGEMVVGNMGTPNKMNYTIMGNAVNLAARLEGANKAYDTGGILISEYTRAQIGDDFVLRPLSRVRVVGINTPLRLYELMDIREDADPLLMETMEIWERGLALYESRDFKAAAGMFQKTLELNGGDLVAQKYHARCQAHIASPPGDEAWDDGVDNLTEK